jgi:hypothetical protein
VFVGEVHGAGRCVERQAGRAELLLLELAEQVSEDQRAGRVPDQMDLEVADAPAQLGEPLGQQSEPSFVRRAGR